MRIHSKTILREILVLKSNIHKKKLGCFLCCATVIVGDDNIRAIIVGLYMSICFVLIINVDVVCLFSSFFNLFLSFSFHFLFLLLRLLFLLFFQFS